MYTPGPLPPRQSSFFSLLPLFRPRIQMAKVIQQTHLSVWSDMSATPGIRHTILHQRFTSGGRPGLFAAHGLFQQFQPSSMPLAPCTRQWTVVPFRTQTMHRNGQSAFGFRSFDLVWVPVRPSCNVRRVGLGCLGGTYGVPLQRFTGALQQKRLVGGVQSLEPNHVTVGEQEWVEATEASDGESKTWVEGESC